VQKWLRGQEEGLGFLLLCKKMERAKGKAIARPARRVAKTVVVDLERKSSEKRTCRPSWFLGRSEKEKRKGDVSSYVRYRNEAVLGASSKKEIISGSKGLCRAAAGSLNKKKKVSVMKASPRRNVLGISIW